MRLAIMNFPKRLTVILSLLLVAGGLVWSAPNAAQAAAPEIRYDAVIPGTRPACTLVSNPTAVRHTTCRDTWFPRALDMSGLNLAHADFTGSVVDDVNLSNVNLEWGSFPSALARRTNFNRSILRNANFLGADITGATFDNAVTAGAQFQASVQTSGKALAASRHNNSSASVDSFPMRDSDSARTAASATPQPMSASQHASSRPASLGPHLENVSPASDQRNTPLAPSGHRDDDDDSAAHASARARPQPIHMVANTQVPGALASIVCLERVNEKPFRSPSSVKVDAAGIIYVADTNNHRIVRLAEDGGLTVVAGTGVAGFNGDGIAASDAQLNHPEDIAVTPDGSVVYVADTFNNRVRRFIIGGNIETVAGNGEQGFGGDGGEARNARLFRPRGVDLFPDGKILIADTHNNRIRLVDPSDGKIITVAGGMRDIGAQAGIRDPLAIGLDFPQRVAVARDGRGFFIADTYNDVVRRVNGGEIRVIAGRGFGANAGKLTGFSGDGRRAGEAAINRPEGLFPDDVGGLYIADTGNHCIRYVNPSGVISTVAGRGDYWGYSGYVGGNGDVVSQSAGQGTFWGHQGDARAATGDNARLHRPTAVIRTPEGHLLIADSWNDCLRVVWASRQ